MSTIHLHQTTTSTPEQRSPGKNRQGHRSPERRVKSGDRLLDAVIALTGAVTREHNHLGRRAS